MSSELELRLHELTTRVDNAFSVADRAEDDETRAHLARYLCIVTSGYLEEALKLILEHYVESTAAPNVVNYVTSKVKTITNLNAERLSQILNAFSEDWKESFLQQMDDQEKAAIDSLVANRNSIAHGGNVGVSYVRVRDWYLSIKSIVTLLRVIADV